MARDSQEVSICWQLESVTLQDWSRTSVLEVNNDLFVWEHETALTAA